MGPIDRFTRDEVSAKVWWPLALLFVVLTVVSFRLENQEAEVRRTEASAWAADVIAGPLATSLTSDQVSRPLGEGDAQDVTAALEDVVVVDAVDAVRLWSADGTLLYSSRGGDPVGSQEALNDAELRAAAANLASPLSVIATRTLSGDETEPLFLTYAPVAGTTTTIGEVQIDEGALLADVSARWWQIRVLFAAAALLVLVLALLSMREPVASIGAGVRFYPTSVPASLVVMDREEEVALRQAGAHSRRRSGAGDRRIEELEASKLALEGELQRALSALAALRASKGVPERAIPPATTGPAPAGPVVRVPDAGLAPLDLASSPAQGPTLRAVPSPAPPEETTRKRKKRQVLEPRGADRDPTPEPSPPTPRPVPQPRPVPEPTPQPTPEPTPEPVPEPAPAPQPEPPMPEPAPAPTPVISEPVSAKPEPAKPEPVLAEIESFQPAASHPHSRDRAAAERGEPEPVTASPEPLMDFVILPDADVPAPASTPAASPHEDEAVDVLNRLVAPAAAPGVVDPGEIRAKLARTAALKKPGSRERREEQERRATENDQQPPSRR